MAIIDMLCTALQPTFQLIKHFVNTLLVSCKVNNFVKKLY